MTKAWKIWLLVLVGALIWGRLLLQLWPAATKEAAEAIAPHTSGVVADERKEEKPEPARLRVVGDPFQSSLFFPAPKAPPAPPPPPKPIRKPPRVQYVGVVQGPGSLKAFLRGEKPGLREVARDSVVEGLRMRVIRKDSVQVKWQDSTWWIRREGLH